MSQHLKALRQSRGEKVAAMRAMLDKARAESRDLTAEETASYEAMDADQEKLGAQVEREEKQAALDAKMTTRISEPVRPEPTALPIGVAGDAKMAARATPEYRAAFENFLRHGAVSPALAALQADSDPAGGFLLAPMQMVQGIIQAVDNLLFIRQYATIHTVTDADGLGVASLDADPADADWTAEIADIQEDSTMALGRREMKPTQVAKLIKVSRKHLRKTAGGAESLVTARLAYKHAVTEEKAFLLGTGAGQPLGLFTASNDGIPTSRDVATDNTSTAITGDGLINAKFSLKSQYQARARWLFHRDAVKQIRKIKDAVNGNYVWQPGLQAGVPDRILDCPFDMSEYAPNTFTSGLYVGVIGDMSYYHIAQALGFELQRLNELYAAKSQVGFIGRMEVDGQPVLAEAFARVKLG